MTKRDAPRTVFGLGLPPFGSEVVEKSRFLWYSRNPIRTNLATVIDRRYKKAPTAAGAIDLLLLRVRWKRLAHEVAGETPDHDVFAQFGDLRFHQILNRLVWVLNESLLEQAYGTEKFVELAIDNFVHDVLRLAFDLPLVNLALGFDEIARNICAAYVKRVRSSDVQRDVFHELTKIFVPGHKVRLAIHFHKNADLPLQVDIGSHDALLRRARCLFSCAGDALHS